MFTAYILKSVLLTGIIAVSGTVFLQAAKSGFVGEVIMTSEQLWRESGITGEYQTWTFGNDSDRLADLVKKGIKTATCSAYCFYEIEDEPLPAVGGYSIILDSNDDAVCIIRTTKVYVTTFDQVGEEHAYKEGEGDQTLSYWKKAHEAFFTDELKTVGRSFDSEMKIVCEEFEVI